MREMIFHEAWQWTSLFVAAHHCCVMGVVVDGMNQILVTAGLDGEIRFWGYKKHQQIDSLRTDGYISGIVLHRDRYIP